LREIISDKNKIFRHALELKKKKYREKWREYLIEGPNLIEEALKEGIEIKALMVRHEAGPESLNGIGTAFSEVPGDRIYMLPPSLFSKLSDTVTPQGVMGIIGMKDTDPYALDLNGGNIIVLDRLQDPGNIGTILRTADAAGFSLAVFMKGTSDPYSPKAVRSAAGSVLRMPVAFFETNEELSAFLKARDKKLIVSFMTAEKAYYEEDLSRDCAIVVGNEGNGVSKELIDMADVKIRIPMAGETESLNASMAAGILMYERIRSKK